MLSAMDRTTVLWTLVAFFGGTILFGYLRQLTEDSSTGVQIGVQVGALALVIAVITVIVRRQG